ncbi:MAG: hypothetical protein NDI61_11485 [Bdellovibrionaceae bacterium]|nr:hypothetical protein [Pseudobdellovibrionaceae bacterium]
MRPVRLIAFFLAFTLDVRVHAAETAALPNSQEVLQDPADCVLRASVCAVKTASFEKYKLAVGEASVYLDSSTAVIRRSEVELTLLSGTVWVRSSAGFTVSSEFGVVQSEGGEFWVSRDASRMTASATEKALMLRPRGATDALRVDVGEENWIGRVASNGIASSGVPQAIALAPHLRRWARLFPGTRQAFEKETRRFHASWSRGLASVADYHEELAVQRRQALRIEAERRARLREQEESRSRELRAMFRRKVLSE